MPIAPFTHPRSTSSSTQLLAGPQVPFIGNVVGNIVALITDLGKNGVTGLIALGVIVWLFSNRSIG